MCKLSTSALPVSLLFPRDTMGRAGGEGDGLGNWHLCPQLKSRASKKSPRREVVRSSVGGDAIPPPPLLEIVRHDIACLATCRIIILRDKMNPQRIFDFEPSNPPYLDTTFLGGWRGGVGGGRGGVKSLCLVEFEPWSAKRLSDKPSRGRCQSRKRTYPGPLRCRLFFTQLLSVAAAMSLFFVWRCRLTPKKPSWVFLPACLPA